MTEPSQNIFASERYFERPEVIKAYREQQEIQTPEYTVLGDEAKVGGRLRARGEEVSPHNAMDWQIHLI